MSAFEYMARFSFNKQCVTFNPGTEDSFVSSTKDFFSNSLEELLKIDLHKNECIDMSKVSSYRRIISKCTNKLKDDWITICTDNLINEDFKYRNRKEA